MATVIVTTIWWSDLLWKGQHLCFLTCLSPQKELHFWTVHGRVTISAEPVLTFNTRLLLAGPLGAKISPDPAQEESEITGRTAAHSSLQSSLRRSLPYLCALSCSPLPGEGWGAWVAQISSSQQTSKKSLLWPGMFSQVCCIPHWALITCSSGAS